MNINLELYRLFYLTANSKSITSASQKLNISQPALSKSIKNLEESLGCPIFTRTKGGITLTPEGEELYQYIKPALELITNGENKISELKKLESGTIKIGGSTTLTKEFLLPILKKYHEIYPKITIQITTGLTSDLLTKLENGTLDIVLLNKPSKISPNITIQKIKTLTDCLIASANFNHLKNQKLNLSDLKELPLILPTKKSSTRTNLDEFLTKKNITLNPIMELTSYALILECVKTGLGIGYLPEIFLQNNSNLFKLNLDLTLPKREIALAYSNTYNLSLCTQKFLELISTEN